MTTKLNDFLTRVIEVNEVTPKGHETYYTLLAIQGYVHHPDEQDVLEQVISNNADITLELTERDIPSYKNGDGYTKEALHDTLDVMSEHTLCDGIVDEMREWLGQKVTVRCLNRTCKLNEAFDGLDATVPLNALYLCVLSWATASPEKGEYRIVPIRETVEHALRQ